MHSMERATGIEPALEAWEAPTRHGSLLSDSASYLLFSGHLPTSNARVRKNVRKLLRHFISLPQPISWVCLSAAKERSRHLSCAQTLRDSMERAMGVEPTSAAWEAAVLPMNYARNMNLLYSKQTSLLHTSFHYAAFRSVLMYLRPIPVLVFGTQAAYKSVVYAVLSCPMR